MRDFPEINKKLIGGITEKQTIAKGFLNVNQSVKKYGKENSSHIGCKRINRRSSLKKIDGGF
jgi:hypothetical protein